MHTYYYRNLFLSFFLFTSLKGVFLGLRAKSLHQMVLNGIVMGAIGTGCAYSSRMVTHPIADATSQYNNMYSYMPGAKKVEE
jgi:hypothetical protein